MELFRSSKGAEVALKRVARKHAQKHRVTERDGSLQQCSCSVVASATAGLSVCKSEAMRCAHTFVDGY